MDSNLNPWVLRLRNTCAIRCAKKTAENVFKYVARQTLRIIGWYVILEMWSSEGCFVVITILFLENYLKREKFKFKKNSFILYWTVSVVLGYAHHAINGIKWIQYVACYSRKLQPYLNFGIVFQRNDDIW